MILDFLQPTFEDELFEQLLESPSDRFNLVDIGSVPSSHEKDNETDSWIFNEGEPSF
jgi:hypothetical protein